MKTFSYIILFAFVASGCFLLGQRECRKAEKARYYLNELRYGYQIAMNDSVVNVREVQGSDPQWMGDIGQKTIYSGFVGLFVELAVSRSELIVAMGKEGCSMDEISKVLDFVLSSGLLQKWKSRGLIRNDQEIPDFAREKVEHGQND